MSGVCTCVASDTPDYDTSNGAQPAQLGDATANRGDCGYPTKVITGCPGEISCSAHGVCSNEPTYRCTCSVGYTGADCSEFQCSSSPSWFDQPIAEDVAHQPAECASMGHCDRAKGICMCALGYTGGSCNRLICPGAIGTQFCMGHGKCLSMYRLAEELEGTDDSAVYGDFGESTAVSYGATPNNPKTWDFDMVQGCHCDKGYTNFDCSLRTCPYGADPMIEGGTGGTFEVQELQCFATDDAPRFRLGFRGGDTLTRLHTSREGRYTTPWISPDATPDEVQSAMNAIDSIGEVNVTYTDPSLPACTIGGLNRIVITFLSDFGNLPDLKPEFDNPAISISKKFQVNTDGAGLSVKGTKTNLECSGRGTCDRSNGQCKCFKGYTSSDGRQKRGERPTPGTRGDCGAVMAHVVDFTADE